MSEQILVFRSEVLDECPPIAGFHTDVNVFADAIFHHPHYCPFFMPRDKAETNEDFKQIIPYVVLKYDDERPESTRHLGCNKYLLYQRTKKGGEGRLHGKKSIGIGGHVNNQDSNNPTGALFACIKREISEEINVSLVEKPAKFVGVLYDPSDAVGRVHFGFVVEIEVAAPYAQAVDEAVFDPQFLTVDEIKGQYDNLENWSQIVVNSYLVNQ